MTNEDQLDLETTLRKLHALRRTVGQHWTEALDDEAVSTLSLTLLWQDYHHVWRCGWMYQSDTSTEWADYADGGTPAEAANRLLEHCTALVGETRIPDAHSPAWIPAHAEQVRELTHGFWLYELRGGAVIHLTHSYTPWQGKMLRGDEVLSLLDYLKQHEDRLRTAITHNAAENERFVVGDWPDEDESADKA